MGRGNKVLHVTNIVLSAIECMEILVQPMVFHACPIPSFHADPTPFFMASGAVHMVATTCQTKKEKKN